MLEWLRKIKGYLLAEAIEDEPPGSQQAYDTETPRWLTLYPGIIPPWDLSQYLELYLSDSLARAIVAADTYLTVSPLTVRAESAELKAYIEEFIRRIQLDRTIYDIVLARNIYGFGACEIVGNGGTLQDSTEIQGCFPIDPRSLYVAKTPKGRYQFFRQRPLGGTGYNGPFTLDVTIDPESVVFASGDNPASVYGLPLLQPVLSRLSQRNELIGVAVKAAENHANSLVHWHYQSDPQRPEDKDEVQSQVGPLKISNSRAPFE